VEKEEGVEEAEEEGDVVEAGEGEEVDEVAKVEKTFAELGLCEQLCQACEELGWKKPSEIQRESLPYSLAGRDVIGLAETGSGKTGAFGLPMLQALLKEPQGLYGLCLAPTRELAFQITEQLEALGAGINVRCVSVVGGVDMIDQAIALAKKPHIIVATPGRIVDHLENTKGFNLRNLKCLIMDEADRLLTMDFEKELDKILTVIPRQRRTMLFSATMTSKVAKLQRASLTNPVKVEVSKKYQTVAGLQQQYIFFPAKHKDTYLAYVLNEMAGLTSIIFCSTCEHTQRITLMLRNLGFGATPLHGKMSQPNRLGSLNKFKSGQRSILIATDVASRGLDIPSVDCVINFDIPTNSKDYIHRVGRTARAGRNGKAITFVTQYDVELYQRIEHFLGQKMAVFPTEEQNVMLLMERVSEAQRIAAMELREKDDADRDEKGKKKNFKKGAGGGGGRGGGGGGRGGGRGGGGSRGGGRGGKK
jgi:ATP-dependent RNA helicase DDX47/RRP3